MKSDKVFFLGAGFSKAIDQTYPTLDELTREVVLRFEKTSIFEHYEREIEKEYKNDLEKIKEEADAETQRIKDMFGYDGKNYNEDI
jgi:hypothetical protein